LVADVVQESSEKPANTVIRTDPIAGSPVAEQSKVVLVISKGDLKLVPNVSNVGYTEAQARAVLKSAGFENIKVTPRAVDAASDDGNVVGQNPEANQPKDPKSQITIFVGQYTPPTPPTTPPSPTP
ncbi:MAG: PASTA domain-containing protein, partial [Micromonosporaceae bacterium]